MGENMDSDMLYTETALEVQNIDNWAIQIKFLVDHNTVKCLVAGSSSLRIEAGRDSLAGRITSIEIGALLLREIAGLRFAEHLESALPLNGLDALQDKGFWIDLRERGMSLKSVRDRAFYALKSSIVRALIHYAMLWDYVHFSKNPFTMPHLAYW